MSPTTNDPMEPFYYDGDAIVPDEAGSSLTNATERITGLVLVACTVLGRELEPQEWNYLMNFAEVDAEIPQTYLSNYPEPEGFDYTAIAAVLEPLRKAA